MDIRDEHGTSWHVQPGDPATPYVNALKRRGFTMIRLPRVLLRGMLDVPTASERLYSFDTVDDIRLADCLEVLRGIA